MNKKCSICGKYEIRRKEVKSILSALYPDMKLQVVRNWKWCEVKNNWCRNVASKCSFQLIQKENKDV